MKTPICALVLGLVVLPLLPAAAFAQEEEGGGSTSEESPGEKAAAQDEPAAEGEGDKGEKAEGEKAEASVSSADVMGSKKIRLGLRLGYGLPLGEAASGGDFSDLISGMIPIWVDAGYMLTPNILVGAYFQYGFGFAGDSCTANADCSASSIRFGLQGQYHLAGAEKKMDPWFGLGIGWEFASFSATAGGAETSVSTNGIEFLNLQGGVDFPVMNALTAGPFLSFSFGRFSSASINDAAGASIQDKTIHEWLVIGAKGTFAL